MQMTIAWMEVEIAFIVENYQISFDLSDVPLVILLEMWMTRVVVLVYVWLEKCITIILLQETIPNSHIYSDWCH